MTLQEILTQNGKEDHKKLPTALDVNKEQFSKIWRYRENGTWHHSSLIEEIGNTWTDSLKDNSGQVEVSELYLDTRRLYIMDKETKVVRKAESDQELLNTDIENLAAGGAIVQFRTAGLHDEYAPSIAINMNEKGEEIGYGLEVRICSNFNIFNAGNLISTYAKSKLADGQKATLNLPEIKKQVQGKMELTHAQFEKDLLMVEALKKEEVADNQFFSFLGRAFQKIEQVNYFRVQRRIAELTEDEKFLVMNAKQIAQFAVESATPSYPEYKWNNQMTNKWKILNWATEILKIKHGSDIMSVLRSNQSFTQKLLAYEF